MGERYHPTQGQLAWLRHAVAANVSHLSMARHLGVHVDTLKRILVREKIAKLDNTKVATLTNNKPKTWTRPCMRCGCTEPRPRNQYFCDPCRQIITADAGYGE